MIYLFFIFAFIFGIIIGSFLNCLIWRLHEEKGIGGRSICPACNKQVNWYDNIPILSFILLRGRCRSCNKKISWQYPIVEFIVGILFLVSFFYNINNIINFNFSTILFIARDWFFIAVMVVVFIYDLKWYLILDVITLPAIVVLIILNLLIGLSWINLLLAGLVGGGFFLFQFIVSRGRWIGDGDIRLGFLMGVALGWPNIVIALMLAYFIGAGFGIGLILLGKKKMGEEIPFGTFLSVGAVSALFWGERIINWYLGFF